MPHPSRPASLAQLRERMGLLCVAVSADAPQMMLERAVDALRESPFLEFRLDFLPQPLAALSQLAHFLARHRDATAIATCRRREGGGHFPGTLAEQTEILSRASALGFHLIDLEIESAERLTPNQLDALRTAGSAALLLSAHDFFATRDLHGTLERMEHFRPDFLKIVTTARSLADNLTLFRFLEHHARTRNLVGICMGEPGILSRILGPRFGGAFTFGAAAAEHATAPGQLDAHTLTTLYGLRSLTPSTQLFGVAGDPVRHSLSPLMHNIAFRHAGLDAILLPLLARSLPDLLAVARDLPLAGFAVTMPLKREILPHLHTLDPLCAQVGACNTVVRSPAGELTGYNTDVEGVVRPLARRLSLPGARVLVAGAGGASRAALFGLAAAGAELFLVNRTPEKASSLAAATGATLLGAAELATHRFDALVNATPAGMAESPATLPLALADLRTALVFDMVYNPLETPLLREARARGLAVIAGDEMFVAQGARQFELWTGQPAPEAAMRQAVLTALDPTSLIPGTATPATPDPD